MTLAASRQFLYPSTPRRPKVLAAKLTCCGLVHSRTHTRPGRAKCWPLRDSEVEAVDGSIEVSAASAEVYHALEGLHRTLAMVGVAHEHNISTPRVYGLPRNNPEVYVT